MLANVVRVEGQRFNSKHGGELGPKVDAAWKAGAKQIVLDFAGVVTMDSLGLGALVMLARKRPKDTKIALRNLAPAVASTLAVARVQTLFELESSE